MGIVCDTQSPKSNTKPVFRLETYRDKTAWIATYIAGTLKVSNIIHHQGSHFGAPGRRPRHMLLLTAVSSLQGSGVRGSVGQLTRRWPTRDGQVLRATTPEGVSPIIGLIPLPLQIPGLILASRSYPRVDPWHHGDLSAHRQENRT